MAFEDDFRTMAHQTVDIALATSEDEYNARTFGADVTFEARVTAVQERIVDLQNKEQVATHVVWLFPLADGTLPDLTPNDRITLPDATTPPILRVSKVEDDEVSHHMKVFLGQEGSRT